MQLYYFGWVRMRLGIGGEQVDLPDDIRTVRALAEWLSARDEKYAEVLSDLTQLRFAVNQEIGDFNAEIAPDDEVAIFPPMTGG